MDGLLCFGGCFLLAAFVVDVISVASSEWVVASGDLKYGLWTKCYSNGMCVSMVRTDRLDGVRAVMVVSVIISGLALLVVLINIASIWISQRTNRWIVRLVAIVTFSSVILTLVGILLSREVTWPNGNTDYGYGFWLGVAAIALFFISGVLFLVSAVRYHRARKQRKTQHQKSLAQKNYPFIIPHYDYKSSQKGNNGPHHDYKSGQKGNNGLQYDYTSSQKGNTGPHYNYASGQNYSNGLSSIGQEDVNGKLGRTSEMYPFNFDYRYYPTSYVATGTSKRDESSVVNAGLNDSRYSSGSGFPITQLPGQQFLSIKNNMVDDQSSVYSRSQSKMDTNTADVSANIRTAGMPLSAFTTPSMLGARRTSPRIPRDAYGYPLNYNRDD